MVSKTFKPSDVQIKVLKWIYGGCSEDVIWKGYAHRSASRALADHGLVAVVGKGATWSVSLTDAGRDWLEENIFAPERLYADAGALIEAVSRAGGVLFVDVKRDNKEYKNLVYAANRHPDRLRGQELQSHPVGSYKSPIWAIVAGRNWDEIAADMLRDTPLHSLPSTSGIKNDAGIRGYIKDRDWHYVSPENVTRVARILLQIRLEATRRGWKSQMRSDGGNKNYHDLRSGQLKLFPPNEEIQVKIREVPVRGAKRLSGEEKFSSKVPLWIKYRQVHFQGTGQLELKWGYREVSDQGADTVEQQLSRLFAMTEVDYLLRGQREAEKLRISHLIEDHMPALQRIVGAAQPDKRYWAEFEDRFQAWSRVAQMRTFLDRMTAVSQTLDGEEREAHAAWLSSVSQYLDAMDPLVVPAPAPNMGMASREEVLAYIRA